MSNPVLATIEYLISIIDKEFDTSEIKVIYEQHKDHIVEYYNQLQPTPTPTTPTGSENTLANLTLKQLAEKCKEMNLPYSGKKDDLIRRLTNPNEHTKKKKKVKQGVPDTLKSLCREFVVRRSKYGNYTHFETGFVIDPLREKERIVLGVEEDDGTIRNLTSDEVVKCMELGLEPTIPLTL
jgi:hypothetical protein